MAGQTPSCNTKVRTTTTTTTTWVFSHFSPWEKSAHASASPSAELPREVSSWTPAAYGETIGSDEWVLALPEGQTFLLEPTLPRGPHLRASRLSGSASSLLQGEFGTGTRKRVSVLMTSHRFLLADWSRGQGFGIPSPLHGCHTRRRQRWSLPLRAVLLLVGARPRCLASWSVWTRRTVVQCTGFAGGYSPRSMFPSVDDRPKMLDIMAGTDQKYSYVGVWLVCW